MELRLQQFIEMVRNGEMKTGIEAIYHARKHLAPGQEWSFGLKAGGLLAHPPDTQVEPFRVSQSKMFTIGTMFTD
jgi:macrophage erythroblast attacher